MILSEILKTINGEICSSINDEILKKEYTKAFACDLMSDCLSFVKDNCLLITGLSNNQAIRTAEMLDINCIIFVRGKKPNTEMIELANNNNIILITTKLTLYEASGILYNAGISALKI